MRKLFVNGRPMPLKPQYAGPSYAETYALSFADAATTNGTWLSPGGPVILPKWGDGAPKLSYGQVAALARAWKRCAARSPSPSWPPWYELTCAALGWAKPGDKFVMTAARANAPANEALTELFWLEARDLASRLDADGTKLNPLMVDWSYAGYEQSARDAWQQMQAEAKAGTPPTPAPEPIVREIPVGMPVSNLISSSESTDGGGGAALLLLLLLFAGGGNKRKGR